MIKVSVVVPVYNVADYLPACVEALLNQSLQAWEAIFVNDGSLDDSLSILTAYAQKYPQIKVINQENKGLSEARNTGIPYATGEYVYFLDPDDIIHPQLLEICYLTGEQQHADIVYFNFQRFVDEKEITIERYNLEALDVCVGDKEQIAVQVMVWTKCYRRDFIKEIKFVPIVAEDLVYTMNLLLCNPRIAYVNKTLYFYRMRVGSLVRQPITVKKISDYHKVLNALEELYQRATPKEWDKAYHTVFPDILKKQLNGILRLPKSERPELWRVFAKELLDLKSRGLLSFRGHKVRRWLCYQIICWAAKRGWFEKNTL